MPDREKVIKAWEEVLSRDPLDVAWDLIDDTITLLKEQEPVVRCKDCKYHRFHPYEKIPYCGKHSYGWGWEDDDFCSHVERR